MAVRARRETYVPMLTIASDDGRWEAVIDGQIITWGEDRCAVVAEAARYAELVGAEVVIVDPI